MNVYVLISNYNNIKSPCLDIPTMGTMDEVIANMAIRITADAILVGFSLDSYLTSAIALRIPDRITHLVVITNFLKNLANTENISVNQVANTGHMLPLESPQALTATLINILT